ncbi:MAG: GNAT family N-acetyltransferase [Paracoccaceae bacterium]|nr:GNAT family N-acetyltransferase [Paracoccaceae bacterium]MDE2911931.1 GNAT family N-acetyltransferase [Paracoccaceae bacterium]
MTDRDSALSIRILNSIRDIPTDDWDACAGTACPFVSHGFLTALEDSGSVAPAEGWMPCHVMAVESIDRVVGCVPLYLKSHSQGEYVFDHGWADAFERAGGRYYPKLVSAVPFTPVTGPRLLVRPGENRDRVRALLIAGMLQAAEHFGVSSLHVNFPHEDEWRTLGSYGFLQRLGHQFHWHNRGYETFDDFLAALSSRKRKTIRKERRSITEAGISMHRFTGDALTPEHWEAFYAFYRNTTDRKWGWDYLKEPFFTMLHERMADRVVLVMAEWQGQWVAGALNLAGTEALYGRNWGCSARLRNLHFEACYYQAIEHAIENRISRVEAGAQGPHKLQRGYLPVRTCSAHWIAHDGLRRAVSEFLDHEQKAVSDEMGILDGFTPFRKG